MFARMARATRLPSTRLQEFRILMTRLISRLPRGIGHRRTFTVVFAMTALLLAACSPSLEHQVTQQNKSVILAAIQIIPDHEQGFLDSHYSTYYGLSLVIGGSDQKQSDPRGQTYTDSDTDTRWVAIAVDPGPYVLGSIVERTRLGGNLAASKTTRLAGDGRPPTFEVSENETVYIGTIRSEFASRRVLFTSRAVTDTKKSHHMEPSRARDAIADHGIPAPTNFRVENIFEGRYNALRQLQRPWAERPWDG